MFDLEEIKSQLLSRKSVEEVFKNFDWKNFEEMVTEVFRNHEFNVRPNFRFKTKSRYEIDMVAVKNNLVVCVDCKEWSAGRYKTTALKKAIEKQEKRITEFKKFLKRNYIAQEILKTKNSFLFLPVLVTLVEEELVKRGRTLVVPFEKLNTFLLEVENYI